MTKLQTTEQRWIYIGRRRGHRHPLVDCWITSDKDVDGKESSAFKAKRGNRHTIGGIYVVDAVPVESGMSFVNEPRYTGDNYEDSALVITWRAEHDIATARARLDKSEKLAKDEELAALKPLLRKYLESDTQTRILIEVQVLGYLRITRIKP